MPRWEGNELERRTAARLAASGFVPILNVRHHPTKSEFDIYAFHPRPNGVDRVMVQCTVSRPQHDKVVALKTHATQFGCNHWMFITSANPHPDQVALAKVYEIPLLSEHPASDLNCCTVNNVPINVQVASSARELGVIAFFRGMSSLRRRALDLRQHEPLCDEITTIWNKLDGVCLIANHFDRLRYLYQVHSDHFEIIARCAQKEFPKLSKLMAVKQGYAYDGGSYLQSALAVEALNRFLTLVTMCECACIVAGTGEQVPPDLLEQGRIGNFVVSLSKKSFRHLLAPFVFELLHACGGMWRQEDAKFFKEMVAATVGMEPKDFDWLVEFTKKLFKNTGQEGYVTFVPYREWFNIMLLPYFVKGIGVARMDYELKRKLSGAPWSDWKKAAAAVTRECKEWELQH